MSTKKRFIFMLYKRKTPPPNQKGARLCTRLLCSYLVGDELTREEMNTPLHYRLTNQNKGFTLWSIELARILHTIPKKEF
jgi:hypothetical protein